MTTIAGIATDDPNFSILVEVLFYLDATIPGSDLVGTLSNPTADLTVFVPTNEAFAVLATDLGYAGDPADTAAVTAFLVAAVPAEDLNEIVLYHVLPASQSAAELAEFGAVPSLLGPDIGTSDLPTLVDGEPDLIDPSLVQTDILADNGVVHVIDRVLLPTDLPGNDAPTLAALIASDGFDDNAGDFDILAAAVATAGLDGVLADATVDLTVFAPTDQAFVDLATALGFAGGSEDEAFNYIVDALTLLGEGDPIPLLTDVLLYHILGESLQSSEVLVRGVFEPLGGGVITLDGLSLVDADPDLTDPELVALDLQASNGIAHVIDGVLLPADLLPSDGSDDVDFIIGSDGLDDVIVTGLDDDYASGKAGDDLIVTGAGDDVALGGTGFDWLVMGAGDDLALGGTEKDVLIGGAGMDELDGQEGDDRILGGRDNDVIHGGTGMDRISGGAGDDVINGGEDRDIMSGGGGDDTFVFSLHSGADIVTDFEAGHDVLDVSELDIAFTDLAIDRDGSDTLIFFTETGDYVRLEDVLPHEISEADFVF